MALDVVRVRVAAVLVVRRQHVRPEGPDQPDQRLGRLLERDQPEAPRRERRLRVALGPPRVDEAQPVLADAEDVPGAFHLLTPDLGDVGLHVGKTLYVILQRLGGENPDKLADIHEDERSEWMASAYVEGTNLYEDDEQAKAEIIRLNKRVYQLHNDQDHESPFAHIYWTCRQWSYDYFNAFYARIGSRFEKYYPESETAGLGLETVKQHIGDVFQESDGAIVFKGEDHGLHTRVFINSEGLPTYEAKDIGLIMAKKRD